MTNFESVKKFMHTFGQEVKTQNAGPDRMHYGWNELLIYNIKIKDVFIVSDSWAMHSLWDKHKPQFSGEETLAAYKSKKEIMAIAKKISTGKVIWGKKAGIAGFLKKRGGVIE